MEYWSWFSCRLFWQLTKGVMPYGGNSLFHRTDWLTSKGGWPVTLTEDCSLGMRDSAAGEVVMTAAFDPRLASREQTPGRVFGSGGLVKQRTRWDQGFWEELLHGEWRKLPTFTQRLNALYILGMPLIQAINGLFVPLALVGMFTLHTRASVAMGMFLPLIPMVLTMLTQMLGLREFSRKMGVPAKLRHYVSLSVLSPIYQVLLTWPAIKSIVRWAMDKSNWDRTVKTADLADFTMLEPDDVSALGQEPVLQPV
jgi:cellulose synthase/poly-beta-1,6-N-acetylglucosamine synthase-like glycosyltransferase